MKNYGQHNAILCGIREAKYGIAVTMDDDLQHPPEEIPKLLLELDKGADVVYGYPQTEQHGILRDIASKITKLALQSTMGIQTASKVSAFRAFRTQTRDAFRSFQSPFVSIDVLLTWATNRFSAVPVRHEARKIGESNYSFGKLIIHALNMMTGYSTLPLQIATIIGFIFMFFGIILFGYVIVTFFYFGRAVPGFAFIASAITLFSGVQLFVLGIFGEYLARIHFNSFGKPNYVIRERKK
jgi:undecaprenyl-phosphate 4-deoxy-4-formamido-L-arabinose transferase